MANYPDNYPYHEPEAETDWYTALVQITVQATGPDDAKEQLRIQGLDIDTPAWDYEFAQADEYVCLVSKLRRDLMIERNRVSALTAALKARHVA